MSQLGSSAVEMSAADKKKQDDWNAKKEKDRKEDYWILGFALVAATLGAGSNWSANVFAGSFWLALPAIVGVDFYLLFVLVLAALRTYDKSFHKRKKWVTKWFPTPAAGILVMFLLLTASVTGFAALYVGSDVFCVTQGRLDALYHSVLILGFSDFQLRQGYGQLIVLAQLFSGVVLLIGAFPLLISRLSAFESAET